MKTKTTLSISEARKRFFAIAEEVQQPNNYYTLTERGKPKAVIVSADYFESLLEKKKSTLDEKSAKLWMDGMFRKKGLMLKETSRYQYGSGAVVGGKVGGAFVVREVPNVVYTSGPLSDPLYHAKELIKAQLYIELVEKYKYPLDAIEIGRCVKVGGRESRKYIEVDIVVEDRSMNTTLLFAVSSQEMYDSRREEAIRELFELSSAFSYDPSRTLMLVYYTRSHEKGRSQSMCTVVDCTKYKDFEKWQDAGGPTERVIPSHLSLLKQ